MITRHPVGAISMFPRMWNGPYFCINTCLFLIVVPPSNSAFAVINGSLQTLGKYSTLYRRPFASTGILPGGGGVMRCPLTFTVTVTNKHNVSKNCLPEILAIFIHSQNYIPLTLSNTRLSASSKFHSILHFLTMLSRQIMKHKLKLLSSFIKPHPINQQK